jgi:predicted esterase
MIRPAKQCLPIVQQRPVAGEQPYNKEYSLHVRAPYSIHHGDADKAVSLGCDERFAATLTQNKVEHEMYVYPGVTHRETSMNETVLERVKNWYIKHGVLLSNRHGTGSRSGLPAVD